MVNKQYIKLPLVRLWQTADYNKSKQLHTEGRVETTY
jgi:hypothetical protein